MTMPTGPAPRPLPNPGPPPRPFAVGPKPSGPTHPTPTGPPRPLPAPTDCNLVGCKHTGDPACELVRCLTCGEPYDGVEPPSQHIARAHLPYMDPRTRIVRLPSLAQIVGDATEVLTAAIVMLGRQWDPTSGPSDQDDPWGPEAVDIHLGSAVADIRSALVELAVVAATIPARQSTNSASLPGGPPNHPVRRPDEGLTPGLDAGVVGTREGSDAAHARAIAGSNHLASSPASGGLLPGLADAAFSPTAGGTGESNTTRFGRDAGAGSDPRPVARSAGPDGHRREAGVGFALPQTGRWSW